jgi:cobalt/nickel transport system permease protein
MAGNLFLRSYSRSERIYQAMTARGYKGDLRTMALPHLHGSDVAIGLAVTVVLTSLLVAGIVLW